MVLCVCILHAYSTYGILPFSLFSHRSKDYEQCKIEKMEKNKIKSSVSPMGMRWAALW